MGARSIAWTAGSSRPSTGYGQPIARDSQAVQAVSAFNCRTVLGGDANGDLAAVGQRCQQAHDVASYGDLSPERRLACRDCYRLATGDDVGECIVLCAA